MATGHAGNENAAKLTRAQKEQLKDTLTKPPTQCGIRVDFWDVPALRDVVRIKFGVEYDSDSSYQLLLRFLKMSFKLPDPFDKRRDEAAVTERMDQVRQEVACCPRAGRSTLSTRSSSSTRPRPAAPGYPEADGPKSTSTKNARPSLSSAL